MHESDKLLEIATALNDARLRKTDTRSRLRFNKKNNRLTQYLINQKQKTQDHIADLLATEMLNLGKHIFRVLTAKYIERITAHSSLGFPSMALFAMLNNRGNPDDPRPIGHRVNIREGLYGTFPFIWRGALLLVRFESDPFLRQEKSGHPELWAFSKSGGILDQISAVITAIASENDIPSQIYVTAFDGTRWSQRREKPKRSKESICLPGDPVAEAVNHIREFRKKEQWNVSRGLPHHTGILIQGSPGCGKTSLITAIASELNMNLALIRAGEVRDDSQFMQVITDQIGGNFIKVIEDIDAGRLDVSKRENNDAGSTNSNVSLTTLLNGLDGVETPTGQIIIATTNHPEKLDPALLRSGRFDKVITVEYCHREQFEAMARLFELDPSEYDLDYFDPMPGAEVRRVLLDGGVQAMVAHQKQKQKSLRSLAINDDVVDVVEFPTNQRPNVVAGIDGTQYVVPKIQYADTH